MWTSKKKNVFCRNQKMSQPPSLCHKVGRIIALGLLLCGAVILIPFAYIFLCGVLDGCIFFVVVTLCTIVDWGIHDVAPQNSWVVRWTNAPMIFTGLIVNNNGECRGTTVANILVTVGFVTGVTLTIALPFVIAYFIIDAEQHQQKLSIARRATTTIAKKTQ